MLETAFHMGFHTDTLLQETFQEPVRDFRRIEEADYNRARVSERREPVRASVHDYVLHNLPTGDALRRAVLRMETLNQDGKERQKLLVFFKWSEWGKMLGVDIVQTQILPRVIVLGG